MSEIADLKTAFAARLTSALTEAEGSRNVSAFARRTGISYAVLTAYLNGDSLPGLEKLLAISQATGRTVQWLATGDDSVNYPPARKPLTVNEPGEVHLIPVLGHVPAGVPMQRALTRHADEHIQVDLGGLFVRGDTLFALRLDGESMTGAAMLHGDYAVCSMLSTFDVGDVVAVYSASSGESTVKQLGAWDRKRGRMLLVPHPPYVPHPTLQPFGLNLGPDDQVRRVIAVVRRLQRRP